MTLHGNRVIADRRVVGRLDHHFRLLIAMLDDRAGRVEGNSIGQVFESDRHVLIEILPSFDADGGFPGLALLESGRQCRRR